MVAKRMTVVLAAKKFETTQFLRMLGFISGIKDL